MANQDWTIENLTQRMDELSASHAALLTQLVTLQLQVDELRELVMATPVGTTHVSPPPVPEQPPQENLAAPLQGPPDYLPFGTGMGVLWRTLTAADVPGELNKPLHLSAADGHIRMAEATSNPAAPAVGAEVNIYLKADKLVVQFTHGSGDTHYYTLDLTAHAAAWQYSAVAP